MMTRELCWIFMMAASVQASSLGCNVAGSCPDPSGGDVHGLLQTRADVVLDQDDATTAPESKSDSTVNLASDSSVLLQGALKVHSGGDEVVEEGQTGDAEEDSTDMEEQGTAEEEDDQATTALRRFGKGGAKAKPLPKPKPLPVAAVKPPRKGKGDEQMAKHIAQAVITGKTKKVKTIANIIGTGVKINLEFGGGAATKSFRPADIPGFPAAWYLQRPASVKSKRCTDSKCESCTDEATCFHGVEENGWGWMKLQVPANQRYTKYTLEVWARCKSSGGAWNIEYAQGGQWGDAETNGQLSVNLNGIPQRRPRQGEMLGLPIPPYSEARVEVVFAPANRGQKSAAKLWIEAYHVDASVDGCMKGKECMNVFDDVAGVARLKDARFSLRNDNALQNKCMRGNTGRFSSNEKEVCDEWNKCLVVSGRKHQLQAFLGAGIEPAMGLLQRLSPRSEPQAAVGRARCIDPTVDDPETWDCDCAEVMTQKCRNSGKGGTRLEGCLRTAMCLHPMICASWKKSRCKGLLIEANSSGSESTQATSLDEANSSGSESTQASSLDDSLSGKRCA